MARSKKSGRRGAAAAIKANVSASVVRHPSNPRRRTVRGDVQAQNFVGGLTVGR